MRYSIPFVLNRVREEIRFANVIINDIPLTRIIHGYGFAPVFHDREKAHNIPGSHEDPFAGELDAHDI